MLMILCFKLRLVRYLHPAGHYPTKIRKVDIDFAKVHDFEDIKFSVKVRDIRKTEKKNHIVISIFGYENKRKYPIDILQNVTNKNILIY